MPPPSGVGLEAPPRGQERLIDELCGKCLPCRQSAQPRDQWGLAETQRADEIRSRSGEDERNDRTVGVGEDVRRPAGPQLDEAGNISSVDRGQAFS